MKKNGPDLRAGLYPWKRRVKKIIPLIEMSGEPGFKARRCVSCHSNSLPAMTVALARKKGFAVNEEQAKKELGFAIATDEPVLEPNRLGSSPIGGGPDTLGYTLMGMAAAGAPADALTDAHIHYLSLNQYPDGAFRTTSYRPPTEYGPFTTTAVALRAIKLYPIPGRREEFEERVRSRQTVAALRKGFLHGRTIDAAQWARGCRRICIRTRAVREGIEGRSESRRKLEPASRRPAGRLCHGRGALRLACLGERADNDPVYQKGVQWLLRNQLADGSWFAPTRAVPVQPHTFESFPNGWHQFVSDAASCWATMALLFTLPDKPRSSN